MKATIGSKLLWNKSYKFWNKTTWISSAVFSYSFLRTALWDFQDPIKGFELLIQQTINSYLHFFILSHPSKKSSGFMSLVWELLVLVVNLFRCIEYKLLTNPTKTFKYNFHWPISIYRSKLYYFTIQESYIHRVGRKSWPRNGN